MHEPTVIFEKINLLVGYLELVSQYSINSKHIGTSVALFNNNHKINGHSASFRVSPVKSSFSLEIFPQDQKLETYVKFANLF